MLYNSYEKRDNKKTKKTKKNRKRRIKMKMKDYLEEDEIENQRKERQNLKILGPKK